MAVVCFLFWMTGCKSFKQKEDEKTFLILFRFSKKSRLAFLIFGVRFTAFAVRRSLNLRKRKPDGVGFGIRFVFKNFVLVFVDDHLSGLLREDQSLVFDIKIDHNEIAGFDLLGRDEIR